MRAVLNNRTKAIAAEPEQPGAKNLEAGKVWPHCALSAL